MRLAWGQRRRWLRLALVAVCLGMLVVIGTEEWPSEPDAASSAAAEREPPRVNAAPENFTMPPLGAFAEVLARPLFSPTRRPGEHAGALAASSSFTLVAIIITPQDRHALLGFGQPVKIARVREGQDISGWTVDEILPDKVIVRHADVREEVKAKEGERSTGMAKTMPTLIPERGRNPPPPRRPHDG